MATYGTNRISWGVPWWLSGFKDLAVSLLWCRFSPRPGNFHSLKRSQKKKKTKTRVRARSGGMTTVCSVLHVGILFLLKVTKRKKPSPVCVYVSLCLWTHEEGCEGHIPNCEYCHPRGSDHSAGGRPALATARRWPERGRTGAWPWLRPASHPSSCCT